MITSTLSLKSQGNNFLHRFTICLVKDKPQRGYISMRLKGREGTGRCATILYRFASGIFSHVASAVVIMLFP